MIELTARTYLAPKMRRIYRAMLKQVSDELGIRIRLRIGASDYHDVENSDIQFICGLPYVRRADRIAAIAAPVMSGERYRGEPIYFSDVIVSHDSDFQTFAHLRGRSWAYNEPESQSGYGITCYTLVKRGLTGGFFGAVIEAGFHTKSIEMVCAGEVDASAIDSQVLEFEMRQNPELAAKIRIIGTFGPSTIQPICVSRRMDAGLKREIQASLTRLHENRNLRDRLEAGSIERITAVSDSDYDDIRMMQSACEKANYTVLK